MTKEEWEKVEDELFYGISNMVTLSIDGYTVYLKLIRKGMKLKIMVLIKDVDLFNITGKNDEDLNKRELEARNKFFCKKTKNTININEIKKSKLTKKEKDMIMKRNVKYCFYSPFFTSFRTLKSTFNKNCTSIEKL